MNRQEHHEQVALIEWARLNQHRLPLLELLLAIPNGGARHIKTGRDLKAEGVRRGVPDLFLPVAHGRMLGLFIEMKSDTGRLSPEQQWWIEHLHGQGYHVSVCRAWQEAAQILENWLTV